MVTKQNKNVEDEWVEEKVWLEKFWKTVFNYTINWENFILPQKTLELPHLNILPAGFTGEQVYLGITTCKTDNGSKLRFKKRSKFYSDIDQAIKNAEAVQAHSNQNGNYAWADTGSPEPDTKHRNKSYDMAISEGFPFLGPVEYLLSCAEFEFRTGNVYDVKGLARLSVLDSDGMTMNGFWLVPQGSYLGSSSRVFEYPDGGPREAVFGS